MQGKTVHKGKMNQCVLSPAIWTNSGKEYFLNES